MKKRSDRRQPGIVKCAAVLFLLFLMQTAAYAYSQQKISISVKDALLEDVFKEVQKKTGIRFLYNVYAIKQAAKVSITVNDVSLESFMALCLKNTPLTWKISGNTVIVRENETPSVAVKQATRKVRGTVVTTKEPPDPLPGVTVMIKGVAGRGVITDSVGYFEIEANENDVLVFSFSGYSSKELKVAAVNSNNVIISLEEKETSLNQVVVIGYNAQKVKNLASSVSTINMENIVNKPITQLSQALQGGATGIFVNQNSGLPGGDAASIKIRGIGSNLGSDPLVLVDGIPFDINRVDPATVESVTILKDAAAASIYGARAGNGVIVITTKRGKAGKVKVQYNAYGGVQAPTYIPDFVDAATYMKMMNLADLNSGGQGQLFSADAISKTAAGTDPVHYPDTKWNDLVFNKTAGIQEHSLSVSGGTGTARFALSANYLSQKGMITSSGFSRGTVRANTSIDLRKNIVVFMDLFASREQQTEPYAGSNGTARVIGWAYTAPPNIAAKYPAKDDRPGYTYYGTYGESWNPVANLERGGTKDNIKDNVLVNLRPKWEIIPGLELKGQFSYRVSSGVYKNNRDSYIFFDYFTNQKTGRDFTDVKDAGPLTRASYYYIGSNLDYRKDFGKHSINAIAGYSKELNNADAWSEKALVSAFGKVYYSYDERYLLEVSDRQDASSLFAQGKKSGNFPSVAVGWNIHNEKFMERLTLIDQFKIRASYGLLGNNNIDPYKYQSTINSGNGTETSVGNPDITWEKIKILDLGLNVTLWKNKVDFTFDVYDKKTTDLIVNPAPTLTSGMPVAPINFGSMQNKGWELKIGYNETIKKDLQLSVNLGYSYNKTRLLTLAQNPLKSGTTIKQEGYSFDEYYGFQSEGLLQEKDFNNGQAQVPVIDGQKPGDIRYKDVGGATGKPDGKINDYDKVILGPTDPLSNFFANLSLKFKNFDFETLFTGIGKVNTFYNGRIALPLNVGGEGGTPMKWHQDYWTPQNTTARFPRLRPSPGVNGNFSDFWAENGAFVRVKYVQLGYNFSASLINKIKLAGLRIYVNAQNPLTFTKLQVIDPESKGDQTTYPIMRVYTFGLNANF
ncbi:TonB-dependent receptor [Chitinophaga sp. SYP-B3965]|uniref:TonB-dependent receptor n=1 Tax=Chitinophaga sp. SYP-B3965 TaxID=2663120 RepID=UPI0015673046|nr:TonB-dependent receptor [Chitinophaga sp. SYP-B3965]